MSRAKGQAARRVASVVVSATLAASLAPAAPALAEPAKSTVATSTQSIVAQEAAAAGAGSPVALAAATTADSATQQLADGTYSATASTDFGMVGLHSDATIVVRDGKPYAILTLSDEGHQDGETNSPKYDALWVGDDYASLPDASTTDLIKGIPVYGDAIAAGDTRTYNDGSGKVITSYQFVIPTTFDALYGDGIGYVARYTSHYKNGGSRAGTWSGTSLKHFTFASITRTSDATDVPGMASEKPQAAQAVIDQIAALPAADAITASGKGKVEAARAAYDALTDAQKAEVTNLATLTATEDALGGKPAGDIDQARALIAALPTSTQVTSSPSTYEAQINAAQAAYEQLSAAEQETLDNEIASERSESYGRVLEIAVWSLAATKPVDNSTTLEDDTYSSVTNPALSSSYSKGKSTSSRNRPWEVTQITVKDGKAYAEIQVHSNTYSYMVTGGQRINSEKQQYEVPSGGTTRTELRSVFHNVPIKLNQPLYFTAYSTSMQTEITFTVTATIDESAKPRETNLDRFEKLVAELPKDSYEVTTAHLSQIEEAWTAYQGLTDAEREVADETSFAGLTYGRIMLADRWAAWALTPIDNSTTLADGTYTSKSGLTSSSAMGNSDSVRQRKWTVDRVTVKDGKATAIISRDGNDPLASIKWGGQEYKNLRTDRGSEFEVPIDLNSTAYLVSRISGATSSTYGITYSLTNAIDEATAQPDPDADSKPADDPSDNNGDNGGGTGGGNNGSSGSNGGSNGSGGGNNSGDGSGNGPRAGGGGSAVRTPGGLSSGSNLASGSSRRNAATTRNGASPAARTPATGGNALTDAAASDDGGAASDGSDADDATPLASSAADESAPYQQGVNSASASERQAAEARAITIAVIALALATGFCTFLGFFRKREH